MSWGEEAIERFDELWEDYVRRYAPPDGFVQLVFDDYENFEDWIRTAGRDPWMTIGGPAPSILTVKSHFIGFMNQMVSDWLFQTKAHAGKWTGHPVKTVEKANRKAQKAARIAKQTPWYRQGDPGFKRSRKGV